ncbi:hypothetical protein [Streptomyces sp. NPDC048659]|uniref:hypothetical protein n=1 Tax=Streptomyces sp. NPDC048659 TaxID=3155489 RepID=UPI00343AFE98
MIKIRTGALLATALLTLTGCSMSNGGEAKAEGTKVVGVRDQDEVNAETKKVSSEIFDLIGVPGTTSKGGAGVQPCEDRDRERFYKMFHPWSLTAKTDEELAQAMERLKAALPQRGWKIVKYGPDSSASKSLELTADNDERKFGLHVSFWRKDSGGDKNPPMLKIDVVSGCYQVPDGQKVEHY